MGLFNNAFFVSSVDIEFASRGRGRVRSRSAEFIIRNGNSATVLQNAPYVFEAGVNVVEAIERRTNVDLRADSTKTELLDAAAVVIQLPAVETNIIELLAICIPGERIYIHSPTGNLGPLVEEWLDHGCIDCEKHGVLRFMRPPPVADLPPFPPAPKTRT